MCYNLQSSGTESFRIAESIAADCHFALGGAGPGGAGPKTATMWRSGGAQKGTNRKMFHQNHRIQLKYQETKSANLIKMNNFE